MFKIVFAKLAFSSMSLLLIISTITDQRTNRMGQEYKIQNQQEIYKGQQKK